MFTKIKKILIYSTVIAIPFGLLGLLFKYLYNNFYPHPSRLIFQLSDARDKIFF